MTIQESLARRVLILDGALGTLAQQCGLVSQGACTDFLVLSNPEAIASIHREYINAGADIITTNSLNANAISLASFGVADKAAEINRLAAALSRRIADESGRKVWVAGSVGPTNKSLTALRQSGIDNINETTDAFAGQMMALMDGGVDFILLETQFDAINAHAAIQGWRRAQKLTGIDIPIIVSATITENGNLPYGEPLKAFMESITCCSPLAIGVNCSFGAENLERAVDSIQNLPFPILIYPNAGLPDKCGNYSDDPGIFAQKMSKFAGKVNIVGGCCGTTPEHIRLLSNCFSGILPRKVPISSKDYSQK